MRESGETGGSEVPETPLEVAVIISSALVYLSGEAKRAGLHRLADSLFTVSKTALNVADSIEEGSKGRVN